MVPGRQDPADLKNVLPILSGDIASQYACRRHLNLGGEEDDHETRASAMRSLPMCPVFKSGIWQHYQCASWNILKVPIQKAGHSLTHKYVAGQVTASLAVVASLR